MHDLKNIIGIIATILVFVGYAPYIRDIIRGKTKPHIYSWFLWFFVTAIAFGIQVTGGAGMGAAVTLSASLMCLAVLILGIKYRSKIKIVRSDTIFLILSLIALGLWLIAKQPILSAILITLVDVFGFAPTVRKSWADPYSETSSFYYINSVRFALAIFALQTYSIVTAFYPATWFMANGLFAIMLGVRRRQMGVST